jgi:sugar/nucleoside kinase (ribokinase family)
VTARPARICALGDAVVDVIISLSEPPVLDDDVPAAIALVAGGQAANVAAWAVALGGDAAVVTRLGADPAGALVRALLVRQGVDVCAPSGAGATGVIASIVTPDGARSMVSDRGASAGLAPEDLDPAWFAGASWLHISGYALFGDGSAGAALAAAELARRFGARVSVDLSTAVLLAATGRSEVRRRVAATGAQIVFANEAEHLAAGALEVPLVVVKRGAAGCRVLERGSASELAALAVESVRDTTGAGDAFAAGWLVGGAELALYAASTCVGIVGAMPLPRTP